MKDFPFMRLLPTRQEIHSGRQSISSFLLGYLQHLPTIIQGTITKAKSIDSFLHQEPSGSFGLRGSGQKAQTGGDSGATSSCQHQGAAPDV